MDVESGETKAGRAGLPRIASFLSFSRLAPATQPCQNSKKGADFPAELEIIRGISFNNVALLHALSAGGAIMIRFKSISRFVAGTAASRAGRITKSSLTPSVLLLVLSSNALQAAPIDAVQNTSWGQKTAGSFAVTGRRTATDPTGGVGNRITATYTVGGTTTTKEVGDLASQGVGLSGLQVTLGGLPSGTIITFRNESEDGNPTSAVTAVGNFNPPGVGVTTPLAVAFGSTATLGASTFNLSGSFATIATGVDYDPASANYGIPQWDHPSICLPDSRHRPRWKYRPVP